ncbi:MAG: hypothetical protein NT054_04910 [Burkholderiales bacterium]|nr:hypothetical protein [Burkholderiales bacterium]
MKTSCLPSSRLLLLALTTSAILSGCSTSKNNFRAVQTSDGRVGVQTVATAKDEEVMAVAIEECKKLGKKGATISEVRSTLNDRFPVIHTYTCTTY